MQTKPRVSDPGQAPQGNLPSEEKGSRLGPVLDLIGLVIAGATVGWAYVSTKVSGGRPALLAALVGASVAAYAVGRLFGLASRSLVPLGVVAAAAILMMRSPSDVVNSAPHGGFFDYPNTRAAFFVLAAASALTIGVLWRSLSIRIAAFGAAAIFGAVPFLTQTRAAMLVVIGVGVLALGFGGRRAARPAVAIVATVFLLAVAGTTVLAATYEQGGNGRVHLWHGAFNLMVKHPVTGVGPRRFAVASPAARADVDSRHMPDEFLLQGAETGVVGMVLLILLFLWGFARLFFARTSDGAVAIAAAALAGVGMHASVDYVLHLSAVPIITAGLIGSAVSGRRRVGVDRAS